MCPLTPSNAEVHPTTANVVNATMGIVLYLYVVALSAFDLLEFYPFICVIMYGYMHNEHQTFKINVRDHFYWWHICPQ
jgi:hypothetical protein